MTKIDTYDVCAIWNMHDFKTQIMYILNKH